MLISILKFKRNSKPDVVAHAYNPRYLGGRDVEYCGLKPAQAKKANQTPSQQISQAWWNITIVPATWAGSRTRLAQ
jgi:hypothetical protein